MRLSPSHNDQCQHGAAVENPRGEREEVDQGVDGAIQHHCHRYQGLQEIIMLLSKLIFSSIHM